MTSDLASPAKPPGASRRSALIVAHPGHELRVHRWLELERPSVFVLTDGSGHAGPGRLGSSQHVIEMGGARCGSVFGRWSDREAYRVIFDHSLDEVREVVLAIVEELVALEVELVASDAVEGFNPTHDLCFVIAEAATTIASRRLHRQVRHLVFPLEDAPDAASSSRQPVVRLELGSEAWRRKLDAARAYAELREEVDRAFTNHALDAFRVEVLSRVPAELSLEILTLGDAATTRYEAFGEQRVAEGKYREVLRLHEHWLPLADALRRWAASA
ncbi:MAG: hypothetical protein AAGN46_11950 [Acidobacteriota bacterium]